MKSEKFKKKMITADHVFMTILFKELRTFFIKKMLKLSLKLSFFMNMIINKKKFIKLIHSFTMYHIKIENDDILYKLLYNFSIKKLVIL